MDAGNLAFRCFFAWNRLLRSRYLSVGWGASKQFLCFRRNNVYDSDRLSQKRTELLPAF